MDGAESESVTPLFMKAKDMNNPNIDPYEICVAVTNVIGSSSLDGVQKINNLWRIYTMTKIARVQLFTKKTLPLDGKLVPLYDQNPFASRQDNPSKPNDKLTMKYVPISVSNDEFGRMLEDNGVELRSKVKFGYLRDRDGGLTKFRSGDRFVYVAPFDPPLSRNQTVANFTCTVFHHGKTMVCASCGQSGHRTGDGICVAKPKEEIYAFRGYMHPLSNMYSFDFRMNEHSFHSIEQAYYWRMATEMGKHTVANSLKNCKHAGQVKRITKDLASEEVIWEWEENNTEVMASMLKLKAQQCDEFMNCLIENKEKTLAEASGSKLWSTGMSPHITSNTAPDYWPGKNLLGALLSDLTQELIKTQHQSSEINVGVQEAPDKTKNVERGAEASPEHTSEQCHTQQQEQQQQQQRQPHTPQQQQHRELNDESQDVSTRHPRKQSPKKKDTKAQENVAAEKSRGRAPNRTPPGTRSTSTPANRRSANRKAGSTNGTPDIRLAFHSKRKDLESSPPEDNKAKQAKTTVHGEASSTDNVT
jgi:ribA/ribD-fused uncharacterized protein